MAISLIIKPDNPSPFLTIKTTPARLQIKNIKHIINPFPTSRFAINGNNVIPFDARVPKNIPSKKNEVKIVPAFKRSKKPIIFFIMIFTSTRKFFSSQ